MCTVDEMAYCAGNYGVSDRLQHGGAGCEGGRIPLAAGRWGPLQAANGLPRRQAGYVSRPRPHASVHAVTCYTAFMLQAF